MTNINIQTLSNTVQRNCHIADARYASDFTLCIYLLKMREYYRWENGFNYRSSMSQKAVGEWLTVREHLWSELEQEEFSELAFDNKSIAPFETKVINQYLVPQGYVYSAGLGRFSKPHFFLGELEQHKTYRHYDIYITNKEFARELSAYPAMSNGNTIYIRRESLRRMLWEHLETWNWNKPDNAMKRALSYYDFDNDLETALDAMTDKEIESTTLHEIGEVMAGEMLADNWHDMLMNMPRSKAEIMLRSIRDHLADAISTLPNLFDAATKTSNYSSLHFYIANLAHMRKHLFPALIACYNTWLNDKDISPLYELIDISKQHWLQLAKAALELYNQQGSEACPDIELLIEKHIL